MSSNSGLQAAGQGPKTPPGTTVVKELRIKTETTATMVTMDRDVVDDLVTTKRTPAQSDTNNVENESKKSAWWKRGLDTLRKAASNDDEEKRKSPNNVDGAETHYKPLEETSTRVDSRDRGVRGLRGSPQLLRESLLDGNEHGGLSVVDALSSGVAAVSNRATSQEDELQKDCSFFYKAYDEDGEITMTENIQGMARGRFRALRHEEHQHAFSYQDAVDILTPSFVQEYKSRYQKLNQDDPNPHFVPNDHDLVLSESEENLVQIQRIVTSDTTVNSSIFYEHDGRVLMTLPNDAVRLMMDPDLEPGVLSVEQWRREDEEAGGVLSREHENKPFDERAPLRYVLTISPDLYRRVVSEMNDSLTSPYCGISKCCSDGEKADIRIAVAILFFVFFVLFIVTLARGPVD